MLIASTLLPHNRALPFPPHLLLIFLWLCFSSPKCFLTQVCSASQFCSLLHYPLWAMLLQVSFHQKISSVSGFHHLQEQDLKMKQYPIFISFRTSTHLNSHLSLVSLDVPSIVPQEHPLSASLCIQDPGEEQKQLSQSRKKAICRRLTSDSCSQQVSCTCLHEKVPILLSCSFLSSPSPFFPPFIAYCHSCGGKIASFLHASAASSSIRS